MFPCLIPFFRLNINLSIFFSVLQHASSWVSHGSFAVCHYCNASIFICSPSFSLMLLPCPSVFIPISSLYFALHAIDRFIVARLRLALSIAEMAVCKNPAASPIYVDHNAYIQWSKDSSIWKAHTGSGVQNGVTRQNQLHVCHWSTLITIDHKKTVGRRTLSKSE